MNIVLLQKRLLAAARLQPPSDAVPYAFEQRIMACLRAGPRARLDGWALWSSALWRAAAPCLGVMVLISAWTVGSGAIAAFEDAGYPDLETAVFAVIDSPEDAE